MLYANHIQYDCERRASKMGKGSKKKPAKGK